MPGSWWNLVAMINEAADIDQQDRDNPPTSCAQCYTPLRGAPDGKMICPWDGLIWPDDASAWGEFPGSF